MKKDIITSEEYERLGIDHVLKWYGQKFYCTNCRDWNYRYIRRGIRVPQQIICDNCGCSTAKP